MPLRVRVCRSDEVAEGEVEAFAVEGVAWPVLVARLDGELFATTSRCPHGEVSLARGIRRGTEITCPGHGYVFDLATGACRHDPRLALPRYRITQIDGDVYVDLL